MDNNCCLTKIIIYFVFRKRHFKLQFGPQTKKCSHFEVQANYEKGLIPLNSMQNFKEKTFHQLLWTIDFTRSHEIPSSEIIPKKSVCIQWIPLRVVLITITFRRVISF